MRSDEAPHQKTFHPSGVRTLSLSTATNIQPLRGCINHSVVAHHSAVARPRVTLPRRTSKAHCYVH